MKKHESEKTTAIATRPSKLVPLETKPPTFLTPAELAAIWRVSHDKVLEFIRTGELAAFNVASSRSRRPRFRIALAAVTEFEARRSACDSARRLPPALTRRTVGKRLPQPHRYF